MKVIDRLNRYLFTDSLSLFDMVGYGSLILICMNYSEPWLMLLMVPLAMFSAWMNVRILKRDYELENK